MSLSRQLVHEINQLESALTVILAISDPAHAVAEDHEYYASEYPLAVKDVQSALVRLKQLASQLECLELAEPDDDADLKMAGKR